MNQKYTLENHPPKNLTISGIKLQKTCRDFEMELVKHPMFPRVDLSSIYSLPILQQNCFMIGFPRTLEVSRLSKSTRSTVLRPAEQFGENSLRLMICIGDVKGTS